MNYKLVQQKIINYIELSYHCHLTSTGGDIVWEEGPEGRMLQLEEEILSDFGLPYIARYYGNILQLEGFSIDNKEVRAAQLIKRLTTEAEKFLLTPAETNINLLAIAKQESHISEDVLPLLGLTGTLYQQFVYYDFYLRDICTVREALAALQMAEELNAVPETSIPSGYKDFMLTNKLQQLQQAGLPYIMAYEAFTKYSIIYHPWDKGEYENIATDAALLPGLHHISNFVIIDFYANFTEDWYVIKLLIENDENGLSYIDLLCLPDELNTIIKHARYYTYALATLQVLQEEQRLYNSGERKENTMSQPPMGKNIEVNNLIIEIESIDNRRPYVYIINRLVPVPDKKEPAFK